MSHSPAGDSAEVRRSSRSTKGQSKRLLEVERAEAEEAEERRRKQAVRKSREQSDRRNTSSEEAENRYGSDLEDDDDGEGEVRCPCGATGDGLGDTIPMAECEKCLRWQHIRCMFGNDDDKLLPDNYVCAECSPELFPGIEKKWPEYFLKKESKNPAEQSPARADSGAEGSETAESASAAATGPSRATKRRSPSPLAQPAKKSKPAQPTNSASTPITTSDKVRASVVKALARIFTPVVPKAEELGSLDKSSESAESFSQELSKSIEREMYDLLAAHGENDVGNKYRDKFRSLSFNLRDDKNAVLRLKVVCGQISPRQIVEMSSEEMANPELQKLAEDARKESIRETIIEVEEGPRLRRTHKGEEIVGGEDMYLPSEQEQKADKTKPAAETSSSDAQQSSASAVPAGMPAVPARRASPLPLQGNDLWDDDEEDGDRPRDGTASADVDLDDDDLDALLHDDEKNVTTAPVDPPVWTGSIKMATVTEFDGFANHLSAASRKWDELFDTKRPLSIQGRLDESTAASYLQKVGASKELAILVLGPDCDGLSKLYHYFHDRRKYGVIENRRKNVKDAYIVTIGKDEEIPPHLFLTADKANELRQIQKSRDFVVLALFVVNSRGNPSDSIRSNRIPVAPKPHVRSTTPPSAPPFQDARQLLASLADMSPATKEPAPSYSGHIPAPQRTGAINLSANDLSSLQQLLNSGKAANKSAAAKPDIPDAKTLLSLLNSNTGDS